MSIPNVYNNTANTGSFLLENKIEDLSPESRKFYEDCNTILKAESIKSHNTSYHEHFQNHKNCIEAVVGQIPNSDNTKALILGFGNGDDIPFEMLVKKFGRVTLVDVDVKPAMEKVGKLDPALKKKITILRADLTGGLLTSLPKKITEFAEQKKSLAQLVNEIEKIINTYSPLRVTQEKYDFVCSSMLLTELSSQLNVRIANLIINKYNLKSEEFQKNEMAIKCNILLRDKVSLNHIRDLSAYTIPTGYIYFADHPERGPTIFKNGKVGIFYADAYPRKEVDGLISQEFHCIKKEDWTWTTKLILNKNDGSTGMIANVNAYLLQNIKKVK